jgi:hypothetical protein
VDLSGNFVLKYDDNLPPMTTGGTIVTAGYWTPEAAGTPAFYRLEDVTLPDSGQRMWQEVTDLS